MSDALLLEEIKTPVGGMTMISSRDGVLRMLEFQYREARWRPIAARRFKGATFVEKPSGHRQTLDRYFDGDIAALDDIETDGGGTEFQRAVWTRLRNSAWHDDKLRRHCARDRQAGGNARRRPCKRCKPHRHRRALPSRHRS